MKPNIGLINAFVRITCGFTLISWATAKLVRRPYRTTPLFVASMGAMKITEGITRFCPVTYLCKEQIGKLQKQTTTDNNKEQDQKTELFGNLT